MFFVRFKICYKDVAFFKSVVLVREERKKEIRELE